MAEHAHHSANDEYAFTPEGSTYEHTDAHTGIIVKFLLWLAVAAVIVHFGLAFFFQGMVSQSLSVEEPRYPLAVDAGDRLPPAPRLQQFPANEIYEFRLSEQQLLNNYGWMNREQGIVHIPIAEAMRLTVERGLPARVPAEGDAEPAVAVELRPSDSSAGRMEVRR